MRLSDIRIPVDEAMPPLTGILTGTKDGKKLFAVNMGKAQPHKIAQILRMQSHKLGDIQNVQAEAQKIMKHRRSNINGVDVTLGSDKPREM